MKKEIFFSRSVDNTDNKYEETVFSDRRSLMAAKIAGGMKASVYISKEAETDVGTVMSHHTEEIMIPDSIVKSFVASMMESFIRFYLPKGKYVIVIKKLE